MNEPTNPIPPVEKSKSPETSSSASESKPDLKERIRDAVGGDAAKSNKGGRPTNEERVQRLTQELERTTGKVVKLVVPGAPPEAVDFGGEVYTQDELHECVIEGEADINVSLSEGADLLAERYDDNSIKLGVKSSKALARSWNRALTWMLGKWWLKFSPLAMAGLITLIVAFPRVLKIIRAEIARRKAQAPVE